MNDHNQKQLGKTLWNIADQLRGAMNADDFRDYMLSFLFLRYLSDNYEMAAKKELGRDYPDPNAIGNGGRSPLSVWYAENPDDVVAFEKQMRLKAHYVIKPEHLWTSIAHMARTQNDELLNTLQAGFKYIENESFQSTFGGLFSEINLGSEKLGRTYADRNAKLCAIITRDRQRARRLLVRCGCAGRRLRISDRPIRRRLRQEGWRVLYPAAGVRHPFRDRDARQPGARNRQEGAARQACSISRAAPVRCC